jgi:D-alanyl-D-alanine carboxypeptidase
MLIVVAACSRPEPSGAAPSAAHVMDARTGETLYEKNAGTRLHPASLTKMMTLYIAFQEIEAGRLSPDTMVTVSEHAASQPPSRLGLRAGQQIQLRYLIRAAAIKSANDAATAIGEAISGSEPAFARRMTETARAIGMSDTTFKNANGLTQQGHLSTARDMSTLGRHLFYDFPQYYNIFSRRSSDAGVAEVRNTNRRFLDAYEGADGIKTGYTVAAGFNLTASAERGNTRIIATVFGGTSTANRNATMAELLDRGFAKAPRNAPVRPPQQPGLVMADAAPEPQTDAAVAEAVGAATEGGAGKTVRVAGAVASSPRPLARPGTTVAAAAPAAAPPAEDAAVAAASAEMQDDIAGALALALAEPAPAQTLEAQVEGALAGAVEGVTPVAESRPAPRAPIYDGEVATVIAAAQPAAEEVVVRLSTSSSSVWGVNVGRYASRSDAERMLLRTQLAESATLGATLRKVIERGGGYDANFLGMTQEQADLACRRLQARGTTCFTMGP